MSSSAARRAASPQPRFQRLTFQRGTVSQRALRARRSDRVLHRGMGRRAARASSLFVPAIPSRPLSRLPPAEAAGALAERRDRDPARAETGRRGVHLYRDARARAAVRRSSEGDPPGRHVRRLGSGRRRISPSCTALRARIGWSIPIGKVLYETSRLDPGPAILARTAPSSPSSIIPAAGTVGRSSIVDRTGKKADLAAGWATVQGLAWAPGGKEIFFTAARQGMQREVFAVTPAGKLRLVRTMQGTPALLDLAGSQRAHDRG